LDRLRRTESVGLLIVAHDLRIAARADRTFEMRDGILRTTDVAMPAMVPSKKARVFGPAHLDVAGKLEDAVETVTPLGSGFWKVAEQLMSIAAVLFIAVSVLGYGAGRYQEMRLTDSRQKQSELESLALSSLRSDVQSVRDLGDGRYELTLYLWNVSGGKP